MCGIEANTVNKEEIEERYIATAKVATTTTLRVVIVQEHTTIVAKLTTRDTYYIATRAKVLVNYFESIVSELNIVRR